MNIREVILEVLLEWEQGDVFGHVLLQNVLDKYDYLDGRDKAFIKRVTQGTIEQQLYIDYVLNRFSKVPVNKMKRVIRNILRMSVYQILFMDSVPDSAVCNEAVKLANKRKFATLKGFVNGVLRQISREKDIIGYPSKEEDEALYLSVKYSMPPVLVNLFKEQYPEECETILEAFLKAHPVCVRFSVDTDEKEQEILIKAWEAQGVKVKRHPYLSYVALLSGAEGIAALEGYYEGRFTVQDISSVLVGEVADIKPGMHVIDCCAAPGGKTIHAAQMTGTGGCVKAFDVSDSKVDRILENADRMNARNVEARVQDATEYCVELEGFADVLLADVPCSGLGVIGKKQDIKYRINEQALKEIVTLQKAIVDNVWKYLKKDGVMVYSTCTMNREENEKMVEYLETNLPLKREDVTPYLPEILKKDVKNGVLQLRPGVHECDGFFIARLRRV